MADFSGALTLERLRALLSYDENTGAFTRLQPCRGHSAGTAGTNSNGYRQITVDGKKYYAHRLAFFYLHGRWPIGEIDHRDRVKSNNSGFNLREATSSLNKGNVPARRHSKTKVKGVHPYPPTGQWRAQITYRGKRHALGYFNSIADAESAYASASAKLFGAFAHGGQ